SPKQTGRKESRAFREAEVKEGIGEGGQKVAKVGREAGVCSRRRRGIWRPADGSETNQCGINFSAGRACQGGFGLLARPGRAVFSLSRLGLVNRSRTCRAPKIQHAKVLFLISPSQRDKTILYRREIVTIMSAASLEASVLCSSGPACGVAARTAPTRARSESQFILLSRNRHRSSAFQLLSAYLQGKRICIFQPKSLLPWIPLPLQKTLLALTACRSECSVRCHLSLMIENCAVARTLLLPLK
ncbi:hypothetical protein J0S82_010917, partial [Galemys pyrenaicus]